MKRRPLAVAALIAAAAAALLPAPAAAAAAAAASPGFLGVAAADGIRVGVTIEHFLVVSDIVDAGGPAAQALVDSFGDSKAYAAYPYPGEVVLTAHGLSQGAAPEYPLIAQSSNPTSPVASVSQGPYALRATSGEETSTASAQATPSGGGVVAGSTRSTASVAHDADGAVTAEGETFLEGLSFGGVMTIGRLHSHVRVLSRPGAAPVRVSDTEVGDVTIAGQQVGLTDRGLVLPGTTVPLPPDSTANAALAAAGVTVHYLAGYESGPTAVAPGVAVTVAQDVSGVGLTTVTYTLGQVSATAQAGVATLGGLAAAPSLGSPGRPRFGLPAGLAGDAVLPAAGSVPATAALAATVASPAASAPVIASAGSTAGVADGYRAAGLSTGPSTASLYAVVALGAVAMAAAAQLFRVLAVKLTWT